MIRRELKSQVNDLEKRIAAAVKAKRDKVNAPVRFARDHAVEVAAVVLHGEPKVEEPLGIRKSRMLEKLEKQFAVEAEEFCFRYFGSKPDRFLRPHLRFVYFFYMFDSLRGGNDNLKFERVFSEAPAWLLKFTAIESDRKLLGFKLRKLVGTPALGREARLERNKWPSLPQGTIDAGGPCSEPDEPWENIVERRCHELPVPT